MSRGMTAGLILSTGVAVILAGVALAASAAEANKLRVVSDQTVTGFAFPESVGCDTTNKVLYVSQFGGSKPQPAEKDGLGKISKLSLDGKILEEQFLPAGGRSSTSPRASGSGAIACGLPTSTWCGSSI